MTATIILVRDTSFAGPDTTRDIHNAFVSRIREKGLEGSVQAVRAADLGIYDRGVGVKILPAGFIYSNITAGDIDEIIDTSVANTRIDRLTYDPSYEPVRIVLRNCGVIDPENIQDYIDHNGYEGFTRAVREWSPERVIEEMKTSGLRGRGGAGYPAYLKWSLARSAMGEKKYVICNGDEGDPGAYMDRSILEGDPHSVIEGMLTAGYAIGAVQGFFYIRAEYPLAIERIQKALDQARERGFLGEKILGAAFSFEIEIRLGAGAFVCGEETALIASIEGKRGTPRPRPPYPSDVGLWGYPTIINNVETLANVPAIMHKGASWFAGIGTEKSKGTKVFALTGKIRNSGLVEIPMGTPLRSIIYDIGGGLPDGKPIAAVQTGGPSGGMIPEQHFDTPVSYEHLRELGSIMGSGGMIVMDSHDCMVDIAKFYLGFCVDESCGKCAPCRIGGFQMLKILEKISEGKGTEQDLSTLRRIAQGMQKASLCALGQSAPNPVVSSLKYFEEIYREHIVEKKCRSGKCTSLLQFEIIPDKCKRCRLCVTNCPVNAISGDRDKGYVVDQAKCTKCGRCFEVCKFEAVARR